MKTLTLILFVMATISVSAQENEQTSKEIIALEKAALERWNNGDVYGFLELSAEDVVYFDPMIERRLNGIKELAALYEPLQGKIKVSKYEMMEPKVQAVENMAVLTFNLKSFNMDSFSSWNCTEVFRKGKDGSWKLIQTHWSFTKPDLK